MNGSQNQGKPYLHVYSTNYENFKNLKFKLLEGSFPKNENEIIISNHIINNGKVNLKLGDSITLNIGDRQTLDGEKLGTNNPYIEELPEHIINEESKTFKIVGIIERPNYGFEEYSDPGYTAISTNIDRGNTNIYLALKNVKDYKTSMPRILDLKDYNEIKKGVTSSKYENYDINTELLRWEVFEFSDSTISMLYSVVGVVIFIIIFTSVFCIRNSFAISITEKIKMYSMLSSVGATKKQIKKNVIFEAMILGIIGIPLGILSGLFADFILLKIVNALLGDYILSNVKNIGLTISIFAIILSIILGFVTIYLSAIMSAKKAAKISPIEGLRSSNDIKIKGKKLKTPKIISKVFKTGGVLAYKNLKRSKKKYRTTVISIAVSIFIFITMNSFITNAFEFTGNYYKDYDYNMIVYGNFTAEEANKMLMLNNIERSYKLYHGKSYIEITDSSKVNQQTELADIYMEDENGNVINKEINSNLEIAALDSNSFKSYCKKIGENYEKVKKSGILCDYIQIYSVEDNNTKELRKYKYTKNDIITGKCEDKEVNIKVGAISKIRPYGLENTYYSGGYLIVDAEEYKDYGLQLSEILIQSNNADKLEEEVKKVSYNARVRNIEAEAKEQNSMVIVVKIFLYGFITVISLIGITNIFNTITSNMELRQKEFAMLKSIGMTKKEFNRMINLETLFYGTKSLIYGIILGLIGTFVMYKSFSVKIDSGVYIPINPIIISIIFVFILVFIIMRYELSKINKQNTIETIRKENI